MLLIGIDSIPLALYIFVMTCVGTFAFASATQGYFLVKNRWYDLILLLVVSWMMFRPGYWGHLIGLENHYLSYLIGCTLYAAIFAMQKLRQRKTPMKPAAA